MKRNLIISISAATAALVVGAGAGFAVGHTDPTESEEYMHAQDVIKQKNDGLDAAVEALEQAGEDLETVQGDLPEREAAVADDAADVAKDARTVEKARRDTLRLLGQVERREKAVGIVEREIANNTISGDGVYRVGTDMKSGTYRSVGNADCYWQLSSDANGSDIVVNDFITAGPGLMSASEGQFFQTQGCGDWVLQ